MSKLNAVTIWLLTAAMALLSGCTFRPSLLWAHSNRIGDSELVKVGIRAHDAETIKRRELYFSLVASDCSNRKEEYPMEPRIAGVAVESFRFPISGAVVEITGSIPASIFDRYQRPCIFVRGGGYVTGKLKSDPIPVSRTDPVPAA